jgi:cyclopropane fatty-acyl-phospholipid synthase-like methyltransferase
MIACNKGARPMPRGELELNDKLTRNYPANYDVHARSVAADAYWKQVRRTVNGEPIAEGQIILIVNAIVTGLSLAPSDVVLDLACGNGALSSYLFDKCAGLVGIDISPYLIEIAEKNFARTPNFRFHTEDVASYLMQEHDPSIFTKALIYGAFQYFSRNDAVLVLKRLKERFSGVTKVFIGNIPNRRQADRFLGELKTAAELNDHEARIGVWYWPEEFEEVAQAAGWDASCSYMPADFDASSYRFDVTLERPGA